MHTYELKPEENINIVITIEWLRFSFQFFSINMLYSDFKILIVNK